MYIYIYIWNRWNVPSYISSVLVRLQVVNDQTMIVCPPYGHAMKYIWTTQLMDILQNMNNKISCVSSYYIQVHNICKWYRPAHILLVFIPCRTFLILRDHKIFSKFKKHLTSSDAQFGFLRNIGTNHALYSLHKTVSYFSDNDSTVNLIWYAKTFTSVKWCNSLSKPVRLICGVRQSEILSPFLFAIYVNDIITSITKSNLGCIIKNIAFSIFMYADDLLLLSQNDMQKMLDICVVELDLLDLKINHKKSSHIRIGKRFQSPINHLNTNLSSIESKFEFRFLGIIFIAGSTLRCHFHTCKPNTIVHSMDFSVNLFLLPPPQISYTLSC